MLLGHYEQLICKLIGVWNDFYIKMRRCDIIANETTIQMTRFQMTWTEVTIGDHTTNINNVTINHIARYKMPHMKNVTLLSNQSLLKHAFERYIPQLKQKE